jgi:hypothetical protein
MKTEQASSEETSGSGADPAADRERTSDPYLRHASDYRVRPRGLTPLDAWRRSPKRTLDRSFVTGHAKADRTVRVPAGEFLCPGAVAIQITETRLVTHLAPWNLHAGKFVGFVMTPMEDDLARVQSKGCLVLRIQDGTTGRQGARVFASDVNAFNLTDGLEIGILLHQENYGSGPGDAWQVLFSGDGEKLDVEQARSVGVWRR